MAFLHCLSGDGERDCRASKPGCCLIWWLNWPRVGVFALTLAEMILRTMHARYRAGVIEQSLARLQEVKQPTESRGASEGGDFTGGGASQGSGG
jgi:uncharacterized membrane protein YgcG